VTAYVSQAELVNNITTNYMYRTTYEDAGLGLRGHIFESCFRYLNEHPIGYLVGFGIKNYVQIGESDDFLFSAMAHNLYIDVLMSVGLVGAICLLIMLKILRNKLKNVFHNKMRLITALPLMVFLVYGLTALTLYNMKTWIYIIMLVINIYAFPDLFTNAKGVLLDDYR